MYFKEWEFHIYTSKMKQDFYHLDLGLEKYFWIFIIITKDSLQILMNKSGTQQLKQGRKRVRIIGGARIIKSMKHLKNCDIIGGEVRS